MPKLSAGRSRYCASWIRGGRDASVSLQCGNRTGEAYELNLQQRLPKQAQTEQAHAGKSCRGLMKCPSISQTTDFAPPSLSPLGLSTMHGTRTGLASWQMAGHECPQGRGRWQAENGAWLPVLLEAFTSLSAAGKDPETAGLCSRVSSAPCPLLTRLLLLARGRRQDRKSLQGCDRGPRELLRKPRQVGPFPCKDHRRGPGISLVS